jgi:hypothetical protein
MNLLDLPTGAVSLEFEPAEFDAVLAALERFGRVQVHRRASHEILAVGDEEFILMNEWDEPCLISKTGAGMRLLQRLARGEGNPRVAAE